MQTTKSEIMKNYDFYHKATWLEVKPKIRDIIEQFQKQSDPQIHNIEQFYQNLEYDHSFIQWMFPNFYLSRFNSNSYKLTIKERDQMIKSETILKRYHQNYILILRFFGIELKQVLIKNKTNDDFNGNNQQTQQQTQPLKNSKIQESKGSQGINKQINSKVFPDKIKEQSEKLLLQQKNQQKNSKPNNQLQQLSQQIQQTDNQKSIQIENNTQKIDQNNKSIKLELVLIDKNQFELCCLKNTHNLLRLKRILSSLSVLKHRKEAIQLCQFLKKELTNLGREKVYEEDFSGFEIYQEEIPEKEMNKEGKRKFNSYKFLYVDKDLVDKVNISIIQ